MITKRKNAFYLTHCIILVAQVSIALMLVFLSPSEEKEAIFLGQSFEKFLLISFLLVVLLAGITLLIRSRSPYQVAKIDRFLDQRLNPTVKKVVITFCLIFTLAGMYSLMVLRWGSIFVIAPPKEGIDIPIHIYHMGVSFDRISFHLQRLLPIIYLGMGLSIQCLLFLAGLRTDWVGWKKRVRSHGFNKIFLVYGLFLVLWGFLAWGSIQLEPDFEGYSWQMVGAPILDRDVLLAFFIGMLLMLIGAAGQALGFGSKFKSIARSSKGDRNFDIVIVLIIWVIAAAVWLSLPTESNWFVFEPRYPNFEFYPKADALKYDITGQNMLLGAKLFYLNSVMHKPLYAAFLALLHTIAGTEFERISMLQSTIFAIFPALVYLLTKRLSNRLAGLIAALLVILREVNSIVLASRINVSNSRLLVTETPSAIGIVLIIWMIFVWTDEPHKKILRIMFIGSGIGLLIQVRNELIFLLPVILLFTFLIYYRYPKYWVKTSALLVAGVILFAIPWQIRSIQYTGSSFSITRRANFILSRLETDSTELPKLPQEYNDIKVENYGGILNFLPSHLVNNQIQAFLIFPGAYRQVDSLIGFAVHRDTDRFWSDCCSANNYLDRLFQYWGWHKWDGMIKRESLPAILTTLFLVSVGIVKSREKQGVRALFPLLIVFIFYLLLSSFRMSGGRRVLVVDWIWITYFSIGLGQLATWVFNFLFSAKSPGWLVDNQDVSIKDFSSRQEVISPNNPVLRWKPIIMVSLLILVIGAMIPLFEQMIPPRYTEKTLQTSIKTVFMLDNGEMIGQFLSSGGIAQQGKAFYPRYYGAGEGERDIVRKYGHLRFFLAGPNNYQIAMPLNDTHQFDLPHYSDVLIFGCGNEYLDPLAIYIEDENYILLRDPFPEELVCPLPIP